MRAGKTTTEQNIGFRQRVSLRQECRHIFVTDHLMAAPFKLLLDRDVGVFGDRLRHHDNLHETGVPFPKTRGKRRWRAGFRAL